MKKNPLKYSLQGRRMQDQQTIRLNRTIDLGPSWEEINDLHNYLFGVQGLDPIGSSDLIDAIVNFQRLLYFRSTRSHSSQYVWDEFWASDYSRDFRTV